MMIPIFMNIRSHGKEDPEQVGFFFSISSGFGSGIEKSRVADGLG